MNPTEAEVNEALNVLMALAVPTDPADPPALVPAPALAPAPAPGPTQMTQEEQLTYISDPRRCNLCPHPTEHPTLLLPLCDLNTPARTTFECGCSVHTKCLWFYAIFRELEFDEIRRCPCCQTTLLTPEVRTYVRQRRQSRTRDQDTLQELWETNEIFKEDVKKIAKLGKAISPLEKLYRTQKAALITEWRQISMSSVLFLKQQQQIFSKRLSALESRRKYILAYRKYSRAAHRLEETYTLGWRGFNMIQRLRGAPRIRGNTHYWHYSETARRIFRIRI